MRIRRLLYLIAIVSITAVLIGALALYAAIRGLDAIDREQEQAQLATRQMSSLLVLTEEYVLDHNDRAARQWWLRYADLKASLSNETTAIAETAHFRKDLLERHGRVADVFKLITDVKIEFDPKLNERRTAMLVGQLISEVEGMGEDAYRWGNFTENSRRARQKILHWSEFALGLILFMSLAAVVWIASRRLILPLARLEIATRAVGEGQLSQRVSYSSEDEFGDVARAFNTMTSTLESQSAELARAYQKSQQEVERAQLAMKHFDSLFALAPSALIVINHLGAITKANEKAHQLFGYDSQQLPGVEIGKLLPHTTLLIQPGALETPATDPTNHASKQSTATKESGSGMRADGNAFLLEFNASPHHLDGVPSTILSLWDVTEQYQLQQSMHHAKELAEAASRAKSEFVANMSHEIRTPMNAVLGMTYLLNKTPLSVDQKKYLDMIRVAGESLLEILNDVLDFSKIEAGRMLISSNRFILDDVLRKLATIMMVNAGDRDLELAIGIEPGIPHIYIGDALRIQQVLVNLAGNAIKFTERGEVSVYVDAIMVDKLTATLRFRICDSGIGMNKEQQARLFTAFSQADESTTRRFGGTGLGLTISKRLIDMMDGKIEVSSQLGVGSEFCVSLPMKIAHDNQSFPLMRGNGLGALRVLVVDDNETSRNYLSKTVQAWRWQAESVKTGASALQQVQLARDSGQPYDVVLVDWQMPGMDGLSTMQAIRAAQPQPSIPIIIMINVFGRNQLLHQQSFSDADAVLMKPVTGSSLFDTLHEVLVTRLAEGHLADPHSAPDEAISPIKNTRILLVEDNPFNQLVAKALLEPLGALVQVMADGAQAVEHLRQCPHAYDLILMDVQMPVMDGFTATGLIRNELKLTLPIIAMTAGVLETERSKCIAAGMDDFIAKPVDVDDMIATLARYTTAARLTAMQLPPLAADFQTPFLVGACAIPQKQASLQAFDIERFLAIAKGNTLHRDTVFKLLSSAIGTGRAPLDQAYAAWQAGRVDDCVKHLHTLRGAIGTLGATRFADAALELERAMVNNGPEQVEPLFQSAKNALNDMLAAAQTWLSGQTVHQAKEPHAVEQLNSRQIERFNALLQTQDIDAYETYGALRPSLHALLAPAQASALDTAMELLAFETAQEIVRDLAPLP